MYDETTETIEARKSEVAGFDLFGKRREDGKVELGTREGDKRVREEWPESVTLGPGFHTYTLEWVRKQMPDGVEKLHPNEVGEDSEPGIEWGIYV